METAYAVIKRIENNMDFSILLKKGLIPLSVLSKKVYYERFLKENEKEKRVQAITNTSEEFKVSERTIYNAIKFMES